MPVIPEIKYDTPPEWSTLRQALQWLRDDIKPIHPAFEPLLRTTKIFEGDYTKEKHLLYAAIWTEKIRLYGCPGTGEIFQNWEGSMKWGFGDHGERQLIPVSKLDEADFEDLDFERGWLGIGFCNNKGQVQDGWAYDDLVIVTSELMRVFPPSGDPPPAPIELKTGNSEASAKTPDPTPQVVEEETLAPVNSIATNSGSAGARAMLPPYLQFLLEMADKLEGTAGWKKDEIEEAIRNHWWPSLPTMSQNLVGVMATLLRDPEAQRGGAKPARPASNGYGHSSREG